MASPSPVLYFAYGSNLWLAQMAARCPSSPLTGLARLRGYKWFINARGYANIAPTTNPKKSSGDGDDSTDSEVWGLIYALSPPDEAQLDLNEGVPYAYEKRIIPAEYWPINTHPSSSESSGTDTSTDIPPSSADDGVASNPGKTVDTLVYIDFKRSVGGHQPKAEYVHRMNMGISDALARGVPGRYVRDVLRGYIPEEEEEGVRGLAERQAAGFREEKDREGKETKGTGSGAVSTEEEGEVVERASEVCYAKYFGV